jgi:hypothetical protein
MESLKSQVRLDMKGDFVSEFTIEPTICSVDLETLHKDVLKNCFPKKSENAEKIIHYYHSNFSAPKRIESYELEFNRLVEIILKPPVPRVQTDCTHVSRLKKKH